MNKVIFSKQYDCESLYDLPEDVGDAVNSDYNPKFDELPSDEYSYFKQGTFTVTITWNND